MGKRSFALVFVMLALSTGTSVRSQQSSKTKSLDKPQPGKLITPIRRVVTGTNADGKSTVIFDGVPPNILPRPRGVGGAFPMFWVTDSTPADNSGNKDATAGRVSNAPPPNGSSFYMFELEPGEGLSSDPETRADTGSAEHSAEPGMHRTKTIDYVVILSGAINMRLEDSKEIQLRAGDVLVQRGVYHNWVNRGSQPCRAAIVQIPSIPFKN